MNEPRSTPDRPRTKRHCFVAMPISTPAAALASYGNDTDHFAHVLSHLFQPAIERAGMSAVPPLASGANLVHAEIVEKIVTSDVVLCDMSCLNPNVFFEMGLRTALNQPLCFVVDDVSVAQVPFDTGIINYHVYRSALAPWTLEQEIEALAAHLRSSVAQSKDGNALWRYFGLRSQFEAGRLHTTNGENDKLEFLTMEVEGLRRKLDGMLGAITPVTTEARPLAAPPRADEISDGLLGAALPAFEVAGAPAENLVSLRNQLVGRLKRATSRTQEAAIEKLLAQIDDLLKERSGGASSA